MGKSLKYLIISLFALLAFSCGIVLVSHDFSADNDVTQQEEKIEDSNADNWDNITFELQSLFGGIGGCKLNVNYNTSGSIFTSYRNLDLDSSKTSGTVSHIDVGAFKDFPVTLTATIPEGYSFVSYRKTNQYGTLISEDSKFVFKKESCSYLGDNVKICAFVARNPVLSYYQYDNSLVNWETVDYTGSSNAPAVPGAPMGIKDGRFLVGESIIPIRFRWDMNKGRP